MKYNIGHKEVKYQSLHNKEDYIVILFLNENKQVVSKKRIDTYSLKQDLNIQLNQVLKSKNIGSTIICSFYTDPDILIENIENLYSLLNKELIETEIYHINQSFHYEFNEILNQFCLEDKVSESYQLTIYDIITNEINSLSQRIKKVPIYQLISNPVYFQIQNRRYLGNKFKLIEFIEEIINTKSPGYQSFCDLFAGTGVVGSYFNKADIKIISNDFLKSNFACLFTFLGQSQNNEDLANKINYLNNLNSTNENYFSQHYGNTYFTEDNAIKIGVIREEIEKIAKTENERLSLLCSLIYAVDKCANTVGHYDAFRKNLDMTSKIKLLIPFINYQSNINNKIYCEDANTLIKKISSDILYIDPPYNSRQYSDAYHLLENLVEWKKPEVFGMAKKMNRDHIKSVYCLKSAKSAFRELIMNAKCKHIYLSYNNTGNSKDGRSNARIDDKTIIDVLKEKGDVEIFEKEFKAFTTGKSSPDNNKERIFYCKVRQK